VEYEEFPEDAHTRGSNGLHPFGASLEIVFEESKTQ
jgi:hypothetical protein